MKKSEYLENATITGHFKTKADAAHWIKEKKREGYDTTGPFHNREFAYSHKHPWETAAMARFTIESSRS